MNKEKSKACPEPRRRVFVGMSGGVDSSVAAYLLKEQDYDVVGVFIRSYNIDGCAERDAEDARRVAEKLNIPFYVFDFEREYKERVVNYMIGGYRSGLTPNPDVMCNKEIKFGLFLEKALALGADFVATGHYVRLASRHIRRGTGHPFAPAAKSGLDSRRVRSFGDQAERASETFRSKHGERLATLSLFEAKDKNKDQSYFLWTLTQEQLKHCLFPVGDYLKSEVREIAREAGLPTADKKDSQGICFLGKVTLEEFLKNYIPEKSGEVLTTEGKKLGEHSGAYFYTIGQRHLGISNIKNQKSNSAPVYVAEKNIKTNTLVVAEGDSNPALYRKEVELRDVSFINPETISLIPASAKASAGKRASKGIDVLARVRYRQLLVPAKLTNLKLKTYKLEFDHSVKFVAAGQSAVFYNENSEMLGGGVIV